MPRRQGPVPAIERPELRVDHLDVVYGLIAGVGHGVAVLDGVSQLGDGRRGGVPVYGGGFFDRQFRVGRKVDGYVGRVLDLGAICRPGDLGFVHERVAGGAGRRDRVLRVTGDGGARRAGRGKCCDWVPVRAQARDPGGSSALWSVTTMLVMV